MRRLGALFVTAAIVAGTAADRPHPSSVVTVGGYRAVAADFHMHSSTWSDGALTPWGLVLEARRQGLDALAITGHNQTSDAKVARWFSRRMGGPTVLVGQEVLAPGHDLIAVGLERTVESRQPLVNQIEDIHRQGGVAIAAHPFKDFWPGFDAAAMAQLDGAEICHPYTFTHPDAQSDLVQFAGRGQFAAIGSSDFHGLSRLGICRTYVFSRDASAAAVLDALRAHRTVVYAWDGHAYGDAALIELAATLPSLREAATTDPSPGALEWVSRILGVFGLLCLAIF